MGGKGFLTALGDRLVPNRKVGARRGYDLGYEGLSSSSQEQGYVRSDKIMFNHQALEGIHV